MLILYCNFLFVRILPIQLFLVNDPSIIEAFHLEDCMEQVHTDLMATGRKRWKIGLQVPPTNACVSVILEGEESSSPGEFHPQALTDTDVTVSRHPALIILLPLPATLPYLPAPPISG